ncbi:DoxX family protein [Kordiimonas aquimaris]|uniref:DoxX family protein n=1 Tax=Kordiimonas aquimaris TaxID=707591 RepID=UPI0021D3D086|nr:DoxX family protein [Kordiimonas aquimaris]
MSIVNTVKGVFERLENTLSVKDAVSLFLRMWIAKIFYQSGRTKASAVDNDPLIELDDALETLKEISPDDATFQVFKNVVVSDEGYYISELTEFADTLLPDSGMTQKIEQAFAPGFGADISAFLSPSENAALLFEDEYQVPLLDPELAAQLALYGETFLPIMLMLGLGARFGAFGLLIMTAVIQIVYPGSFADHIVWAAALIGVLYLGAGKVSLDNLLFQRSK